MTDNTPSPAPVHNADRSGVIKMEVVAIDDSLHYFQLVCQRY
jgi:hypothetical protein